MAILVSTNQTLSFLYVTKFSGRQFTFYSLLQGRSPCQFRVFAVLTARNGDSLQCTCIYWLRMAFYINITNQILGTVLRRNDCINETVVMFCTYWFTNISHSKRMLWCLHVAQVCYIYVNMGGLRQYRRIRNKCNVFGVVKRRRHFTVRKRKQRKYVTKVKLFTLVSIRTKFHTVLSKLICR